MWTGYYHGMEHLGWGEAMVGHNLFWLGGVVAFENLTIGLGRSALLAFMAFLTNRRFTATQFALLASLAGVPRVIVSAPTGWLAEQIGWISFFVSCAVIAIPGLVLLLAFRTWLRRKYQPYSTRGVPGEFGRKFRVPGFLSSSQTSPAISPSGDLVAAFTTYGEDFPCAVHRDNIYGVQFHPEKSHESGFRLLRNFAKL